MTLNSSAGTPTRPIPPPSCAIRHAIEASPVGVLAVLFDGIDWSDEFYPTLKVHVVFDEKQNCTVRKPYLATTLT
jgi:hypothetical protein